MSDKVFIDSNIWLYSLLYDDIDKHLKAIECIDKSLTSNQVVISTQVINEVASNLLKNQFEETKIGQVIDNFFQTCLIVGFNHPIYLKASDLRIHHTFSYWDSLIVACAIQSHCQMLLSEDMHDGQTIESVAIYNPLK